MLLGRRTLGDLGYKDLTAFELEDGDIQFSEAALKDGAPFVAIGRSIKASGRSMIGLPKLPASVQYAWVEGKEATIYHRANGSSFSRCIILPPINGTVWGQHTRDDLLPLHSLRSAIEYAQDLLPVPNDEALALVLGIKLLDEASGREPQFRLTEAQRNQAAPLLADLARAFGVEAEWSSAPTLPAEALEQIVLAWQPHRFLSALPSEGVFSTLAGLLMSGNRCILPLPSTVVRLIQSLLAGQQGPVGLAGNSVVSLLDTALSTGIEMALIGPPPRLLTRVAEALLPSFRLVPEELLDLDDAHSWPVIVCQPPFGVKIIDSVLLDRSEMASALRGRRVGSMDAEALWFEKCHELLAERGLLVMVLPDGFLSNMSAQPARRWIMGRFEMRAVFSLPASVFRPATAVKCSIVCLQKARRPREHYHIFMSELEDADLENSAAIIYSYRQVMKAEDAA